MPGSVQDLHRRAAFAGSAEPAKDIYLAERLGFEPRGRRAPTGFRDRPIRPLWHLSAFVFSPNVQQGTRGLVLRFRSRLGGFLRQDERDKQDSMNPVLASSALRLSFMAGRQGSCLPSLSNPAHPVNPVKKSLHLAARWAATCRKIFEFTCLAVSAERLTARNAIAGLSSR